MVKKLYKHEFLAYARIMVFVYAILLTMAAANRIIQIFEADTIAYKIISVFSGVTYGVSVAAAFGFSFVLSLVRFYRNLFSCEGYLSFTLPVTPRQHITVKVVTAICVEAITLLVVLISGCIVTAGEMLVEICKALGYLLRELYKLVGGHMITVGLEFVLLLIVAGFSSMLLYYTFISIGQLFKKNRILAAVGAYFVYYILSQIFSTVLTIVFSILSSTGALEQLGIWVINNAAAAVHIGMWGMIGWLVIAATVEFFAVKWIITKKLNLE